MKSPTYPIKKRCSVCWGTGEKSESKGYDRYGCKKVYFLRCPICNGKGYVEITEEMQIAREELRKTWSTEDYWQYSRDGIEWYNTPKGKELTWTWEYYRVHPHNNEMNAFDKDKEIQRQQRNGEWKDTKAPDFNDYWTKYRIKPQQSTSKAAGGAACPF